MTEPSMPHDGRLVAGKYEVVGLIGRGGMGSVWEGRHATLGTRVAIKFIDQEYANSREAQSRFVNEARAAATIHSKHAIQIFDHGVADDGRPYIVMELLEGVPLGAYTQNGGRVPAAQAVLILQAILAGLAAAHAHEAVVAARLIDVRQPGGAERVEAQRGCPDVHQRRAVLIGQIHEVVTGAAHRSDRIGLPSGPQEDGHQTRNAGFSRSFVDDVGAAQTKLRPRVDDVVDHDGERIVVHLKGGLGDNW